VARIVIPDLPGHGFSDAPPSLDAQGFQQGVLDALDAVTAAQPALVFGNSLGGYAALRYALDLFGLRDGVAGHNHFVGLAGGIAPA
jgi:pimeloyl-ACP methyl ester carboxylesterase